MDRRSRFLGLLGQTSPDPVALDVAFAKGSSIYDREGRDYIDLISGIGVSNLGHGHPEIHQALRDQLNAHLHVMVYGEYIQDAQLRLAEGLAATLPAPLQSSYFVNSGSEAVEAALKLVRRATGRTEIICCHHAYHGSTMGALSLIGAQEMRAPFEPLLPNVRRINFNATSELAAIGNQTAGVIVEPVQGEAGVIPADKTWLQELRAACDRSGALLIFDECQTGMGRTGSPFYFQQVGVIPDILIAAKGLGGGMPLGALMASNELLRCFTTKPVLGHITTFGGHPMSCAAGAAALAIVTSEAFGQMVLTKGQDLAARMGQLSCFGDIRRVGMMASTSLSLDMDVMRFCTKALDHGLLLDWFLFAADRVRFAPPLTISTSELDKSFQRLDNMQQSLNNSDIA